MSHELHTPLNAIIGFVKLLQDRLYEDEAPRKMDPLYDKAVQIVAEAQKVSTSMIQRRLGVGYNRAAKIVEAMEEQGVIGPSRGTTPREVFVSAA